MMELFLGTFSRQVQSIKNLQLTRFVTTIWLRNINLISIDYGFRPRLRCRLTLRGLTLRRNPWIFGEEVFFTSFIVTYVSIRTSDTSRIPHGYPFTGLQNVPLPVIIFEKIINPQIRYMILAPLHLRRRNSIRPVSCYAIFKGWLLLSQPPGC